MSSRCFLGWIGKSKRKIQTDKRIKDRRELLIFMCTVPRCFRLVVNHNVSITACRNASSLSPFYFFQICFFFTLKKRSNTSRPILVPEFWSDEIFKKIRTNVTGTAVVVAFNTRRVWFFWPNI